MSDNKSMTNMTKRTLGRTGLDVSVLGVGGHTYPVGDGPNDFCTHEERAQLIAHLVAAGVNYFDTTWLNEVELLADSFRRAPIQATSQNPLHVSLQYVDGISDSKWRQNLRAEVENRLRVMNYDRAPLFIMGVGNNKPPLAEIRAAVEALHALKEEGLIQNIGVSCHELTAFESLAKVIEETDLLDYMMIRYNWKFQQAAEKLFPVAKAHNVGVVVMKVFCWDCGPDNWGRRISVFEPIEEADRHPKLKALNAAQRSWLWCVQNAPCATSVPALNARWEADQLLEAVPSLAADATTSDFDKYINRLYDNQALKELAGRAESAAVRERAAALVR